MVHVPKDPLGEDWISVTSDVLPVGEATAWAIRPDCGALSTFFGTVRDHSPGRSGVTGLDYEAYLEQVEPKMQLVADEARERWPMIGRIVALHRLGRLEVGDISVFVAASTPSRPESFAAVRFLIDTIKSTVPIWKKETWADGSDWAVCDHVVKAEFSVEAAVAHAQRAEASRP